CMEYLIDAGNIDPSWSVPVTNITVLLLEEGRTDQALELLEPMCYKNTPALILAGIEWRQGNTDRALRHLSEALISTAPKPEVLAAAGIVWSVTGNREMAGNVIRRLLENPEAPSELRVLALRYALMLGE
ncbi:MAG: tetratricopeptide repeat protein, partial [Candidatus Sabulitectum sp.]|nr:tetratricopeptide repeat protein [Candidatus Sabulitectum sp.]